MIDCRLISKPKTHYSSLTTPPKPLPAQFVNLENLFMKKSSLLMLFALLCASPEMLQAKEGRPADKKELTTEQQVRLAEISRRVEEIRTMDRSNLSRQDRKELRNELQELKKEAKVMKGGVYLSVGAIIIIILVLILIL